MRASSPGETHPLPEGHHLPGAHAKQGRPPVGCTFPVSTCTSQFSAHTQWGC
jgi:hypothetical protein